ncbi:MAG TPA: porphobilinogen synthase [Chitinophagales bacterium]|nr:porphobilinogen synthase [Chitinophagales bacterium]HRK26620.1 porphobilinogen synthase [Chitinophagales bacterium]
MNLPYRPRRLRRNNIVREMIAETRLSKNMFIYPMFVCKGNKIKHPIAAMPGVYHFSPDELVQEVQHCLTLGIDKFLLFGVGDPKSANADSSHHHNSAVPTALRLLKAEFANQIYLITDVCVCAYTTHGHCGILAGNEVLNDESVEVLAQMALTHAQAGADMVAPSDMMDGRIGYIRQHLDQNQFTHTAIMSYAVKYASAYYGPFREAADSSPQLGNRKGYQMDYRNAQESLREAWLDEHEGADVLMVKPALAYLDIIARLKQQTRLPVACYNVSGEYSMVKAAAAANLIDEEKIVMENMIAFARSGADIIITYHAKDILQQGWM